MNGRRKKKGKKEEKKGRKEEKSRKKEVRSEIKDRGLKFGPKNWKERYHRLS